jgi:hypothetical protein
MLFCLFKRKDRSDEDVNLRGIQQKNASHLLKLDGKTKNNEPFRIKAREVYQKSKDELGLCHLNYELFLNNFTLSMKSEEAIYFLADKKLFLFDVTVSNSKGMVFKTQKAILNQKQATLQTKTPIYGKIGDQHSIRSNSLFINSKKQFIFKGDLLLKLYSN